MTFLIITPVHDNEVLEFWSLNAQWNLAAAEALRAYLG